MTSPSLSWPSTLPRSLDYPEVAVSAILAGAARRFPDRAAFVHGNQELSYSTLWQRACRFANALTGQGIGVGDRVVVHLPNRLAFPVAYYGIQLAGATFCPANPLLPPGDLLTHLVDCAAAAIVTTGRAVPTLASMLEPAGRPLVIVSEPESDLATAGEAVGFEEFLSGVDTPPVVTVDVYRDLAHLAPTGGTTGRPKSARISHRNAVVNSLQYACWTTGSVPARDGFGGLVLDQVGDERQWPVRLGAASEVLLTPWFHAMGTIGGLNVPVLVGRTMVLHDRLDPAAYLEDVERRRVTSIGGAPALFAALLAHPDIHTRDLTSVRVLNSGAAPLRLDMINELRRILPHAVIGEGYGLTEATMVATSAPIGASATRKVGSVGLPVFDTKIKIVPTGGGERALPSGERGEICVRGPQVMAGYHNRPLETDQVLVDGWLHTGDIGVLDGEGYLYIVDRKKDMLIYKGYNVYPRELEELLIALPAVADAAVVGRPDDAAGDLPVAFVVRATGHDGVDANELLAAVNRRLAPYKRLRELHFVNDIPLSPAGKVPKHQLVARLEELPRPKTAPSGTVNGEQ